VTSTTARPSALDSVVNQVGDLRAVALMRMFIGAVVIRHFWPDLRAEATPVERFHVPWWSWLPEPSPATYRLLLWVGVAAGAAMVLGVAVRAATGAAFAVVSYLLFVDMSGFAHNRGYLVWMLFGLTLCPRGPRVGLIWLWSRSRTDHGAALLWPLLFLRIIASSVYLTSGLTKLANPDWRGGLVLWDRVVRNQHEIPFDGWIHDTLTSRDFHRLMAPSAIAAELFIGLGVWFPRTRLAAIWLAIVFHTSIEITASVQTFSYTAIAALLVWVTPSAHDRRIVRVTPRLASTVNRLDWLDRFVVTPSDVGTDRKVALVDRDGTERHGYDAIVTVLSRLPAIFGFVAPLLAWQRIWNRPLQPTPPSNETTPSSQLR
jgi:uncharacterized membrane protein YphA (DoxX/SURF4 family)